MDSSSTTLESFLNDYDIAYWTLIAEWFAAVGTVGALFLGIGLYIREKRDRRHAAADAFVTWHHLMFIDSGNKPVTWTLTIHAFNGGSTPIPFAIVVAPEGTPTHLHEFLTARDNKMNAIHPGETVEKSISFSEEPYLGAVFVRFSDSKGRRWIRHLVQNSYISERSFKLIMSKPHLWKYPSTRLKLPEQ